mmetsp:Transcript_89631/g.140266  ORF Transcript_89631/g.140266 Transcript_89631/m.140266 type:complete len:282 (-) Transcript_89631:1480-2325(-)
MTTRTPTSINVLPSSSRRAATTTTSMATAASVLLPAIIFSPFVVVASPGCAASIILIASLSGTWPLFFERHLIRSLPIAFFPAQVFVFFVFSVATSAASPLLSFSRSIAVIIFLARRVAILFLFIAFATLATIFIFLIFLVGFIVGLLLVLFSITFFLVRTIVLLVVVFSLVFACTLRRIVVITVLSLSPFLFCTLCSPLRVDLNEICLHVLSRIRCHFGILFLLALRLLLLLSILIFVFCLCRFFVNSVAAFFLPFLLLVSFPSFPQLLKFSFQLAFLLL